MEVDVIYDEIENEKNWQSWRSTFQALDCFFRVLFLRCFIYMRNKPDVLSIFSSRSRQQIAKDSSLGWCLTSSFWNTQLCSLKILSYYPFLKVHFHLSLSLHCQGSHPYRLQLFLHLSETISFLSPLWISLHISTLPQAPTPEALSLWVPSSSPPSPPPSFSLCPPVPSQQ